MAAIVSEAPRLLEDPVERAREGDHDAFAELVERHQAMVYSLARHILQDRGRAEEIAQDVFLQLYRSLRNVQSQRHAVHWLRQVTTRRCIDVLRRTPFQPLPLDAAGPLPAFRSGVPADPFLAERVRTKIAALPPLQRAVVTLRYQEDLDPSEICEIVGLPVNTVKSHLHRALRALRRQLGDG